MREHMSQTDQISDEHIPAVRRFFQVAGGFVLIYGLMQWFYLTPALAEFRTYRELFLWPVTLVLLFLYWAGYNALKKTGLPLKSLAILAGLTAVAAFLIPNFHSTDLFGYINRGWQQLHYGLNPYVYTVDQTLGWEQDPMMTNHWVNNPSPYGFLYLQLAKLLCIPGGGQLPVTVWVFKGLNLLIHAVTAALVWLTVQRLNADASEPKIRADMAFYLYAFNPLVMVHGLANGHNDMIMGFFVTLSAYFAIVGAWLWILPALVAATLIKYGALVIIPPAVLLLIKQRAWRALLGGVVLGVLVFGLSGLSYLPDWQSFHLKEIERNAFVSHGSLHSMIYSSFKTFAKEVIPAWHLQKEAVRTVLKNMLLLGYVGFYGWLGLSRLRQKTYPVRQWIQDALLVMAVMICLVSLKFYPWYFGMFFPLALFLEEGFWLRRLLVVMSGAQLFSLTFIGQAHLLNFIVMTGLPIAWLVWQRKYSALMTPARLLHAAPQKTERQQAELLS